jgi:hypothetical protein
VADQVALRLGNVGKVHAPARNEHAEKANFAVNAVGSLVVGVGVDAN